MLSFIVKLTRIGVIVFWVAMILSLSSVIPAPYSTPIIWIGIFVLVSHLSAYFYVRKLFDSRGGVDISFAKTLVFGFTHWLPLVNGSTLDTDNRFKNG